MDNMIPIETNDKERNVRLKAKVLEEIISSELSYLSQLDMLLNVIILFKYFNRVTLGWNETIE